MTNAIRAAAREINDTAYLTGKILGAAAIDMPKVEAIIQRCVDEALQQQKCEFKDIIQHVQIKMGSRWDNPLEGCKTKVVYHLAGQDIRRMLNKTPPKESKNDE